MQRDLLYTRYPLIQETNECKHFQHKQIISADKTGIFLGPPPFYQ